MALPVRVEDVYDLRCRQRNYAFRMWAYTVVDEACSELPPLIQNGRITHNFILSPRLYYVNSKDDLVACYRVRDNRIGIAWSYARTAPYSEIEESIKHEVAHAYCRQSTRLDGSPLDPGHGRVFIKVAGFLGCSDLERFKTNLTSEDARWMAVVGSWFKLKELGCL